MPAAPQSQAKPLLAASEAEYGSDYKATFFEQYKLFVDSARQVTEWRSSANRYFMSINTALITLFGLAATFANSEVWQLAICAGGILLAISWGTTISGYKSLNEAKFGIIHRMEDHLPLRPFTAEWKNEEDEKQPKLIVTPSLSEFVVPSAFCVVYLALIVLSWVPDLPRIKMEPIQVQLIGEPVSGNVLGPIEIKLIKELPKATAAPGS
jgi:hypothetical protein